MRENIDDWINHLRITVSPRTAEAYEYHLRRLDTTAPERRPEDWTTSQLVNYIGERRASGVGEALTKQTVAAFRGFFRHACGDKSPAERVPYPKIHKRRQRTLEPETMLKVLASCDTSTHLGTRDLAILSLMLDSGLRCSELCRLKLSKLDMDKRRFDVIVKGGNEQSGVFSRTTAAHLARWLAIRAEHAQPEAETVFVSIGGAHPGATLSRDGLKAVFKVIGQRAGIGKFSPHDLRRTFATIAIRNGAPTRVVQAAGRWGDISMVEHYTADIQAEDMEKYSPVEALMKGRN